MLRLIAHVLRSTVLVLFGGLCAADEIEIGGRVLDAEGRPAAGVEVGTLFLAEIDDGVSRPNFVTTDEAGRFSLKGNLRGESLGVLARTADHLHGAAAAVRGATEALELRLAPTVEVTATFTTEGGPAKGVMGLWVFGESIVVQARAREGRMTLRLPPGKWNHAFYDESFAMKQGVVDVPAGERELRLGPFEFAKGFAATYTGKPVPEWHVSAARNIELGKANLEGLRGRWVLLEFWGHW